VPSESELSSDPRIHALAGRDGAPAGTSHRHPERGRRPSRRIPNKKGIRHTTPFCFHRAGSGPLTPFSFLRIVRTTTRSVRPRSSRRNAVIGPLAARSLRLRCAQASRALRLRSRMRGRRSAFGARLRCLASARASFRRSLEPHPPRFRLGLLLRPAIRNHLRRRRATSGRGSRSSRRSRRVTGCTDRRLRAEPEHGWLGAESLLVTEPSRDTRYVVRSTVSARQIVANRNCYTNPTLFRKRDEPCNFERAVSKLRISHLGSCIFHSGGWGIQHPASSIENRVGGGTHSQTLFCLLRVRIRFFQPACGLFG
jgi:hypothetical protein